MRMQYDTHILREQLIDMCVHCDSLPVGRSLETIPASEISRVWALLITRLGHPLQTFLRDSSEGKESAVGTLGRRGKPPPQQNSFRVAR